MRSNPEPDKSVIGLDRNCPEIHAHAGGPIAAYILEMKRGMFGVCFQEFKVFRGKFLYRDRQLFMADPEGRCREVVQSGVVRLAL